MQTLRSIKQAPWVPPGWLLDSQIAEISMIGNALSTWASEAKSLAEKLSNITASEHSDYGGQDDRGSQFSRPVAVYEDARFVDFEDDLIWLVGNCADQDVLIDMPEDVILYQYPLPVSAKLEELEERIFGLASRVAYMVDDDEWIDALEDWADAEGDPTWAANAVGALLAKRALEATKASQEIFKIASQWVAEGQQILSDARDHYEMIGTFEDEDGYVAKSVRTYSNFARSMVAMASTALRTMPPATYATLPAALTKTLQSLKQAALESEDIPGMLTEDINAIHIACDSLHDAIVAPTREGIRTWDSNRVKRADAEEALEKLKMHWIKVSDDTVSGKRARLARKAAQQFGAVPAYRFNVGSTVRVGKSNTYGKVIGCSVDRESGKHMYSVRLTGRDHAKTYIESELSHA